MKHLFLFHHVLFLVLTVFVFAHAQIPKDIVRRVKKRERIVSELAEEVSNLFQHRSRHIGRCSCSRHICLNDATGFECVSRLGKDPEVCGPNCRGRRIGYEWSAFKTPPDTPLQNMEPRLKEAICLYSHLEPKMKELVSNKSGNFLHFSGTEGHQRIYPVLANHRGLIHGEKELHGCAKYDPRISPWFLAASTRPKDIVFVVDVSGSMLSKRTYADGKTRWDITEPAVSSMLDSLTSADYVNVVTFSDYAERLWTNTSLLRGTTRNLDILKQRVKDQYPAGLTVFDSAFREAFDILTEACDDDPEGQSCSNCQKVILFLTDGRDTSQDNHKSISATSMLRKIEKYQQKLEKSSGSRAMIFTFSMGEDSDGSIPRQISCANNGSWSFIGSNEDPLTAMASYYHFLTNSESQNSPVWVNSHRSDDGQEHVTTVSKAVFTRGASKVKGIFLGVVGHTVRLGELEAPGWPYQDILDVLTNNQSESCAVQQSPCQLQVNRNAFANKAVCADHISHTRTGHPREDWKKVSPCYLLHSEGKRFKVFSDQTTWDNARENCEKDSGRLATIQSDEELAFVAGIASPDGSWIGARRQTNNATWRWIDRTLKHINLKTSSDYWAVGEPNNYEGSNEECVEIDRRGANGNLNDENCKTQLSFICEYSTDEQCNPAATPPKKGYYSVPPLSKCVHEEEALAKGQPLSISKDLTYEDVMCHLGKPANNFSVICCPDCEKAKRGKNKE